MAAAMIKDGETQLLDLHRALAGAALGRGNSSFR